MLDLAPWRGEHRAPGARGSTTATVTPGVLLAGLVGVGHLAAGSCVRRGAPGARVLSVLAGTGLVAFEVVEARWLGPHPGRAPAPAVRGCHRDCSRAAAPAGTAATTAGSRSAGSSTEVRSSSPS